MNNTALERKDNTPRVYFADLADYNSGILRGFWLDLPGLSKDEILERVDSFLKARGHEEWAIHDYENLPRIGEWEPIENLVAITEAIEEMGFDVVNGYLSCFDSPDDYSELLEKIQERYAGTYTSLIDYAYQYIDDTGLLADVPETITNYFDYESFARDMELGGDIYVHEASYNEKIIFHSY